MKKMVCEIQIDDQPPFVPEKVLFAGNILGEREATKPGDEVRGYLPMSKVAVIKYVFNGLRNKLFFRNGVWETGTDGIPRFHVSDMLA